MLLVWGPVDHSDCVHCCYTQESFSGTRKGPWLSHLTLTATTWHGLSIYLWSGNTLPESCVILKPTVWGGFSSHTSGERAEYDDCITDGGCEACFIRKSEGKVWGFKPKLVIIPEYCRIWFLIPVGTSIVFSARSHVAKWTILLLWVWLPRNKATFLTLGLRLKVFKDLAVRAAVTGESALVWNKVRVEYCAWLQAKSCVMARKETREQGNLC